VEVPTGTRTTRFGPVIDYERAAKPSFSRPMTREYGLLSWQKFACQRPGHIAKIPAQFTGTIYLKVAVTGGGAKKDPFALILFRTETRAWLFAFFSLSALFILVIHVLIPPESGDNFPFPSFLKRNLIRTVGSTIDNGRRIFKKQCSYSAHR
jgi:hypothetical protein